MTALADLARVGRRLGILDSDSTELADVLVLLEAVSDEVRRLTRRSFEGANTTYDRVLRTDGTGYVVMLPEVPVDDVTSVSVAHFDGTQDDPLETTEWRLDDGPRGRIELASASEFVRVVWATTGEVPTSIVQAVEDWVADRWSTRPVSSGQTGYRTGEDGETWSPLHVGLPPVSVARALGLATRLRGGVV